MSADHYLGQRLSYSSSLCTVRYIGSVKGTKGEWLGVEWDDPRRGKHDGSHDGVRYFRCRSQHLSAGSFVRPSRPSDPPVGFLEALHQKYAPDAPLPGSVSHKQSDGYEQSKHIQWGRKVVEEVGFDKIRRQQAMLNELSIVLLDGSCVAGLTSDPQATDAVQITKAIEGIKETCTNILELDLSRNLLERWDQVAGICRQLRRLRSLRVNGNRFGSLELSSNEQSGQPTSTAFSNIRELALDDTLLSWEEIANAVASFSALQELSASFNNLSIVDIKPQLHTITKITLEHNSFTFLSSLSALSTLPRLQSLYMGHNIIKAIKDPDSVDGSPDGFHFSHSVSYVDLSYNAIEDWAFINLLQDIFPGLSGLRVSHNPLYEESRHGKMMGLDESFMLTLARLPELKTLNFSSISGAERTNAELYYLSRIARELEEVPESEEASVLAHHLRYAALCEAYGSPTIIRKLPQAINPDSLEARMITFTFSLIKKPDEQSGHVEPLTKVQKIPRGFDMYRVKGFVGRLFGVKPLNVRLVWETGEMDPVAGDMDANWDSEDDEGDDDAERKGNWAPREIELEVGTREVGFWVDVNEAKVRVEPI